MSVTFNLVDRNRVTIEKLTQDYQEISPNGLATIKISAVKAGYTPVGIVGFYVTNAVTSGYSSYCYPYIVFLNSSNEAEIHLRNTHTSGTAKVTVELYVLYA